MPRRNLLVIVCVVMLSLLSRQVMPGVGDEEQKYEFYRLLVDALDHVERSYVTKVDRQKLLNAALQGMLNSLDPYSAYIGPDHYKQFEKQTKGHFGGIGIQISVDPRTHELVVVSPLVGTPAYRAGILAGDRIVAIEGKSTKGIGLEQAVDRLTGPRGTQVTLTVRHENSSKTKEITLTREEIKIPSVLGDRRKEDDSWDWIIDKEAKIAYIRLSAFISSTAADLNRALEQASKEGMKGLVLDLRFNPGGLLQSAIDVADLFLKRNQRIVSTKGRNVPEHSWDATGRGQYADFPIAVLVNHYSASASEVVAAALKDNHRAIIVGERTWGKGSVQNVIELEDGRSAIKLTTAEYHRPNGHNIHRRPGAKESDEWGVKPDKGFEIKLSPEEMHRYLLYRRARDVVRPHQSQKPDKDDKETKKPAEKKTPPAKQKIKQESEKPQAGKPKGEGAEPEPFVDRQLNKALEYLRSQLQKKVASKAAK